LYQRQNIVTVSESYHARLHSRTTHVVDQTLAICSVNRHSGQFV